MHSLQHKSQTRSRWPVTVTWRARRYWLAWSRPAGLPAPCRPASAAARPRPAADKDMAATTPVRWYQVEYRHNATRRTPCKNHGGNALVHGCIVHRHCDFCEIKRCLVCHICQNRVVRRLARSAVRTTGYALLQAIISDKPGNKGAQTRGCCVQQPMVDRMAVDTRQFSGNSRAGRHRRLNQ